MAMCEYELQREARMAENRRRMEDMGLFKMSDNLRDTIQRQRQPARRAPSAGRAPRSLVDAPKRRSSRLDGKPATNYNENALDLADRPERKSSRSSLLDRHTVSQKEIYTEEHVKLLGEYKEPWELFKDGYDAAGNRVYDRVSGMTCHQCRQKTLGRHTACSECQTLHGVFCGDCLFMRYGENLLEVEAAGAWVCPPCRGLCNCSFHRIRAGWAPTGTLYRRAIAEGYKSVAHYLVLTKLATAAAADAAPAADAQPAAAAPDQAPTADAAAGPGLAPTTEATAAHPPQQEGNAGARAGASPPGASKLRQAHIDAILPRATKRAALGKKEALLKLVQPAGVPPKGLGKGLLEKKNRGAADGQGLARLTRAAAAAGAEATTLMGLGPRALRSRNS